MVSPEGRNYGSDPPEHAPREVEPVPFCRSAQYPDYPSAMVAYAAVHETIFLAEPGCDLFVYRLMLNHAHQVAVLGEPPPAEVVAAVDANLSGGTPVDLPRSVRVRLEYALRRQQAMRVPPWAEGDDVPAEGAD